MPPHYGKFIAYFRVSTDRQGKSGLGLAAQREAVMSYLDGGRWALVDEFTEIESGKRNDRPELVKALAACKKQKAKLVIAKLDRLSRNLAFIATLMDSARLRAWFDHQRPAARPTGKRSRQLLRKPRDRTERHARRGEPGQDRHYQFSRIQAARAR